jgi:hypothetical protein
MPGFDGTGPMGAGPMTGRGLGYCSPSRSGYGPVPAWGSGYRRPAFRQIIARPVLGRARSFGRTGLRQGRGFRG